MSVRRPYVLPGEVGEIPSSGVMVSVKLRTSVGSGKWVFIVSGSSSSVRSGRAESASQRVGHGLGIMIVGASRLLVDGTRIGSIGREAR